MLRGLIMANLVLRFVLELLALAAMGYWGFATQDNWVLKIILGLGIPVLAAAAWGVFRVPGDGGPPVVITPPQLRLLLEVVFFGLAVGLLYAAGQPTLALVLLVVLVVQYASDYRRTTNFIAGRGPPKSPFAR